MQTNERSEWSNRYDVHVQGPPGVVPHQHTLHATPLHGQRSIEFDWSDQSNVTYQLSYRTLPDGDFNHVGGALTQSNYTHTGLSYGVTYEHTVRANSPNAEGPWATNVQTTLVEPTATPQPTTTPLPVATPTATATAQIPVITLGVPTLTLHAGTDSVTITWNHIALADSYDLFYWQNGFSDWVIIADNTPNNAFVHTNLAPGVYWYTAAAQNDDGVEGDFSSFVNIEVVGDGTVATATPVPTLTATPVPTATNVPITTGPPTEAPVVVLTHEGNAAVRITWTAVDRAQHYLITYYNEHNHNNNFLELPRHYNLNTLSVVHRNLRVGEEYQYAVRGHSTIDDHGPWSDYMADSAFIIPTGGGQPQPTATATNTPDSGHTPVPQPTATATATATATSAAPCSRCPIPRPENFSIDHRFPNYNVLSWTAVAGADRYLIQYKTRVGDRIYWPGVSWTDLTRTPYTQYDHLNLMAGNDYLYRVHALNPQGFLLGDWSEERQRQMPWPTVTPTPTITPLPTPVPTPYAPFNVQIMEGCNEEGWQQCSPYLFDWYETWLAWDDYNDQLGEKDYIVYDVNVYIQYDFLPYPIQQKEARVKKPYYRHIGLATGAVYKYEVRVYNTTTQQYSPFASLFEAPAIRPEPAVNYPSDVWPNYAHVVPGNYEMLNLQTLCAEPIARRFATCKLAEQHLPLPLENSGYDEETPTPTPTRISK